MPASIKPDCTSSVTRQTAPGSKNEQNKIIGVLRVIRRKLVFKPVLILNL